MVLDLNALSNPVEKTKEQYMAEASQQIASMLKISAMQIRINRDNIRSTILENENYTAAEFNAFLGETKSEQLADIDTTATELLGKVSV
jgi:hypothetical protein